MDGCVVLGRFGVGVGLGLSDCWSVFVCGWSVGRSPAHRAVRTWYYSQASLFPLFAGGLPELSSRQACGRRPPLDSNAPALRYRYWGMRQSIRACCMITRCRRTTSTRTRSMRLIRAVWIRVEWCPCYHVMGVGGGGHWREAVGDWVMCRVGFGAHHVVRDRCLCRSDGRSVGPLPRAVRYKPHAQLSAPHA